MVTVKVPYPVGMPLIEKGPGENAPDNSKPIGRPSDEVGGVNER